MDEKIEEMAMIALKNTMSYICAKQIAMNFYNAGYRKESDTAREILTDLSEYYFEAMDNTDCAARFDFWCRKYGVDLGE